MGKLLAALVTFSLGIALGSGAWAQDDKSGIGNPGQNQNQGQDRDKNRSDTQTICGVVAGVTAEGELAIDYRTNRVVMVQAAYLTVVGSPKKGLEGASNASSKPGDSDRQAKEQARDDESGEQRENIYVVWLSPRTKIFESNGDSGRSDQKKEVSLDRLEVGDRVEVQFNRREESDADAGANQTEQMRRKHGRNRIVFGDATAITILRSKSEDKSSSGSQDSSKGDTEESRRDK